MLTIFTIPKPFLGLYRTIQTNAIKSWLEITRDIILFGDEVGVEEISRKFHLTHIPGISKNKFGTPLISDAISQMYTYGTGSIFAYINCDIVLMGKINKLLKNISIPKYLMVGQRWPLNIKKQLVGTHNWKNKINNLLNIQYSQPTTGGSDYFIYPKSVIFPMPPFAVGRYWWDSWFIYYARSVGLPVINSTPTITAVHQQHYMTQGMHADINLYLGDEAQNNLKLLGGRKFSFKIFDADYFMTPQGLKKQPLTLPRRIREAELRCIIRSQRLFHFRILVLLFDIGRKLFIKVRQIGKLYRSDKRCGKDFTMSSRFL